MIQIPNLQELTSLANDDYAVFRDTSEVFDKRISASNLKASILEGLYFNIKDYGALVDGITDDTLAIQDTIDAANGGTVWFPSGTTVITSALEINVRGTKLLGSGQRASIIKNSGIAGTNIIVTADEIRGFTIENLKLEATNDSSQGACILIGENFGEARLKDLDIVAYGADAGIQQVDGNGIHLHLQNIRVNGATTGYDFYVPTASVPINTLLAETCYANDCRNNGWLLRNIDTCTLIGCSSDNNGRIATGYAFFMAGNVTTLIGCSCENNGSTELPSGGYYVIGGRSVTMIGCSAYNQGNPWIVNSSNTYVTMLSCRLNGAVAYGGIMFLTTYRAVSIINCDIASLNAISNLIRLTGNIWTTDFGVKVETTGSTLTGDNSGNTFTNVGATGLVSYVLPSAVLGLTLTFIVTDADGIRLTAVSGDEIRLGTTLTSTNRRAESTELGASITIVAINATTWVATNYIGIWTLS